MKLRIEPLSRSHDRKRFDCGQTDLNQYLCSTARQHGEKGIARTFVIVSPDAPGAILGFFTLAACGVLVEKLPRSYAKTFPSRIPAIKLARLAVATDRQGCGLGQRMMLNAMKRVLRVDRELGIASFFVDAKDDAAASYYRRFGFIPLPDNPLELFLPMASIRKAFP